MTEPATEAGRQLAVAVTDMMRGAEVAAILAIEAEAVERYKAELRAVVEGLRQFDAYDVLNEVAALLDPKGADDDE